MNREAALEAALVAALDVIDYLAPPTPSGRRPNQRMRVGIESDSGEPGRWDGGRKWQEADERIAQVVGKARSALRPDITDLDREVLDHSYNWCQCKAAGLPPGVHRLPERKTA